MSKKALFLDRDGVINKDLGYVSKKEDFIFTNGIFNLVRFAKKQDYLVIVITNQSGIARGFYSEKEFNLLTKWMCEVFKSNDSLIDKVYFCPSLPFKKKQKNLKENYMRKPNPGMIFEAKKDFDLDLTKSVLIGDKITDVQAGISARVGINLLFNKSIKLEKPKDFKKVTYLKEAIPYLK